MPSSQGSQSASQDDAQSPSQKDSQTASQTASQSVVAPENVCHIWILDSLGGKHKSTTIRAIKRYLYMEACDKYPTIVLPTQHHQTILESRIKASYPNVPCQRNSTDCGVFVLYYTELLFAKSPERIVDYLVTKQDLKNWFSQDQITEKRQKLKELIEKLYIEFSQLRNIDPLNQPSRIENIHDTDGSSSPIQMFDFNPDLLD